MVDGIVLGHQFYHTLRHAILVHVKEMVCIPNWNFFRFYTYNVLHAPVEKANQIEIYKLYIEYLNDIVETNYYAFKLVKILIYYFMTGAIIHCKT